MQDLNPAQREAVRYLDGPLLVLAGAGSGKTRVITRKIAYLIGECGYPAQHVAAITFTNKAAREMRERAERLATGQPLEGLIISTFHALGARILRQEARHLDLKPAFSILDAGDCAQIVQELDAGGDKGRARLIQALISRWKNALVTPTEAAAQAADDLEVAAARVYGDYQQRLAAWHAVDFDDLIRLPVELFERHEEVAARWRARLWHLLVDEYQDTNRSQYRLMKLLAGERASFTAVGDDDQSIYAWRGADIANLHALRDEFPQLKVVPLTQNYRSTMRILTAANRLIALNPKPFAKELWSERGGGEAIRVQTCRDGAHEAEWVVARLSAHRFEHRGKWSDYAILYRGNHQARAFEEQLRAQRIPYVLSGGQSFFDRAEIRDLMAYLRLMLNGDDDPAFLRAVTTPRRGIGGATLEALGTAAGRRRQSLFAAVRSPGIELEVSGKALAALREFCAFIARMTERAATAPAGEVLDELLAAIGYEAHLMQTLAAGEARAKWQNVGQFRDWLAAKSAEEGRSLLDLAQTLALATLLDQRADGETDAVQLATLHAAKGLEFKHVFLVGVEEGLLPHRDSLLAAGIEEERRLMYVGITRAQLSLTVTWCERRQQGREWLTRQPSRFIAEMGAELPAPASGSPGAADREAGRARLERFRALLAGKDKA